MKKISSEMIPISSKMAGMMKKDKEIHSVKDEINRKMRSVRLSETSWNFMTGWEIFLDDSRDVDVLGRDREIMYKQKTRRIRKRVK